MRRRMLLLTATLLYAFLTQCAAPVSFFGGLSGFGGTGGFSFGGGNAGGQFGTGSGVLPGIPNFGTPFPQGLLPTIIGVGDQDP